MKFPKVYQRYLVTEWAVAFSFSVASFFLIIFTTEIFEGLRMMMDHNATLRVAMTYHAYQAPYLLVKLLPISTLMATLYTVAKLAKTNELLALRTSGLAPWALAAPLVAGALVVSLANFLIDETVVPVANARARALRQEHIYKAPASSGIVKSHMTFTTSQGTVVYARWFDGATGAMEGVSLMDLDPRGRVLQRVDAARARYADGRWRLEQVVRRTFDGEGGERYQRLPDWTPPFLDPPRDFLKAFRRLEELNLRDAWAYIQTLKRRGEKFTEEAVYMYLKTSFPFASLILALLGIPFALLTGKRLGVIFCFSLSIFIGFLYWGCLAVGVALGKNAILSPLTAAWLGNLLFGGFGLAMLTWKKS